MSKSRLEMRVGAFVLICLVVLAGLLLQFSKGTTFFRPTYTVILKASNVGGLRARASVLMSGVQVGFVEKTLLNDGGQGVRIFLTIYKQHPIHSDAIFAIEQSGFLGDQFVAIYPGENHGDLLGTPGHMEATAQEPFNLQEAARKASGFIQRMDDTAKKLDDAITDVRRLVLNEQTLSNVSFTVGTLRQVSEDALATVSNVNGLVVSSTAPARSAVSNLVNFSTQLNGVAVSAQGILNTNAPEISAVMANLRVSTAALTNLLADVQAGRGLAGVVLRDPKLASDVASIAANLSITSSNLNRLGVWGILWAHPPPKANVAPAWPNPGPARGQSQ